MKTQAFPLTVTEKGVSAVIRQSKKIKDGKTHHYFIVEYFMLGKRKQVWRSGLDDAKAVAFDVCRKMANGETVHTGIERHRPAFLPSFR